jgi:hypothetical protein
MRLRPAAAKESPNYKKKLMKAAVLRLVMTGLIITE